MLIAAILLAHCVSGVAQGTGILREVYMGIPGVAVSDLTNAVIFPNSPTSTNFVTDYFEAPINIADNYGQRMRGYLLPPETGYYTFWISSDDNSALYLSPDEDPASRLQIAAVPGWTSSREWTKYPDQQSTKIWLEAGRRYYVEALQKENGGGDNLAVGWKLPDGSMERPIPASRLLPEYGTGAKPAILVDIADQTVIEGSDVRISVLASDPAPVSYLWQSAGNSLASQTNSDLVISNVPLTLNQRTFDCILSNSFGITPSRVATLTVQPDLTPPTVVHLFNVGSTNVQVTYSKPVQPSSATSLSNYTISGGVAFQSAAQSADGRTVTLTVSPLTYYTNYSVTINNVRDRTSNGNLIAANTTINFAAAPFAPEFIGMAAGSSTVTFATNAVTATATGSDLGGQADQFSFSWQQRTGDFDFAVRVSALGLSDVWAKAGLIARETLDPGARFAAALTTPSMNGSFFESRDPADTGAVSTGSFPANYPDTWLRLQRSGNVFTGFAGYDGKAWTPLGSATITMPASVYFGIALSSHATNRMTTAVFQDLGTVVNPAVLTLDNPHEQIGPSSRKSPIAFSEIMYKPAPRADTNNIEFIELYNSNPWFQDISGYQVVCDQLSYTVPPGTVMAGGSYLVIAASPASMTQVYGITNVLGPYTGSLRKSGNLQLLDEQGSVLLTVPYANTPPWPVAADGTGHSLVLANPTYGEGDPKAWDISDTVGGSPGGMDTFHPDPLRSVVINEFLAHTDPPDYDYVELYNHSNLAVDLSGCVLTDNPSTNKFVIPSGTIIPARGFVYYSETNMNFALSALGESIYFKNPAGTRVLDAVSFGGQENGVATGRWPDGADEFYRLSSKTPGAPNPAILINPIAINELMYHPISGNDDDQYVELYNQGTQTIDLSGWTLADGISFTFPTATTLGPNSYLVVARNAGRLRTNYPGLGPANCLGNFSGKLSHGGERIALQMPDTVTTTNNLGTAVTNLIHIDVDEVTYGKGGRWGQWAAGGGSSLELIDPHSDHRLAANWADSDETKKSSWVNIEATGVLDNGANYEASIAHAQLGLLDVGECLVDNVEVRAGGPSGTNCVLNPDFESNLADWSLQGDHHRSGQENEGYGGSNHSLHLRSSDHVWTGDNSCQAALGTNALAAGGTATLRFKARWLHGWPEVLLRLNGNWLEAVGTMPVPANLGTPGAANSRRVADAGPAIYDVTHTPTIPAANQNVVVTARVQDPDGVQSFSLYYRVDPATSYASVTMKDDGTGGDAIAGDGVFSATIPGQNAGTIVAFILAARDNALSYTTFPAILNDNAPTREGVIMFGDGNPGGSFGVYHLWITQTNATLWTALSDLSNEAFDCTFVNGKRVIYDTQARFAGSPYHQGFDTPYGNLCHYKWIFPDDDKFLGATSFNKIHEPGNGAGDDASLQREQTAYTFMRALGVPWLNRRYVAVYVNGNRRGQLMEDTQTPDGDVVDEHFPNDNNGFLYKMQPWFEFGPDPTGISIPFQNYSWCNVMPYTTTGGVKKVARYRYNYLVRRTPDSASNYTPVFSLVDAAQSPASTFVQNMESTADMENWMRVFAANHAAGNWDSFGSPNGQNLYGYNGTLGTRYTLMMFDFNIVLGNSGSWGPGQNLFAINGQDNTMSRIYNEPAFRRMYFRALGELVSGPLDVASTAPLLDAKYSAFLANGLSVEEPGAIKDWLTQAHDSIQSQVAAANTTTFSASVGAVNGDVATITGTAPFNVDRILINGAAWPLTWTSDTNWSVTVPLMPGANQLTATGTDRHGQVIAGSGSPLTVNYGGAAVSPIGQVIFSEIMSAPAIAGAEFVELQNRSGIAFDLSGWKLQGLAYTFPPGSLLAPNAFLVLAANRASFAAAYGAQIPIFDTFAGTLQPAGETLTLSQPGATGGAEMTVAKVRYSINSPWPTGANATGSSLQLVDSAQDNWRAGNWQVLSTNVPAAPQWTYVTATGTASSSTVYVYLQSAGDVYVDDLKLVSGSVADVGPNLIPDGDFEAGFPGSWGVSPNLTGSTLDTSVKHAGAASLHLISTSGGSTRSSAIYQDLSPALTGGNPYTISFWYLQSTNGGPLTVRLSGSGIVATVNPAPPASLATATPGATNTTTAMLAPFPAMWINEVQAENLTGITNRLGQRTAWIEIYNPSVSPVSLNGIYLANNYTNLSQWAFPTGAVINPGQFELVFADGQTNLTTSGELHAGFVLSAGSGSVALTRMANTGQLQVLDFLDYTGLPANYSYGSYPDAQSFDRQSFYIATPRAANDATSAPLSVSINEWMAGNTHTIQDPLDSNKYDDWFELYNYGDTTAVLGGYYLSHVTTNQFEFEIPAGYTIPAHGFLLVWADKVSAPTAPDLHVNFHLSKSGTSIGLYGSDGRVVDYVSFGAQTSDISQGRFPDGGSSIYTLPRATPASANAAPNMPPSLASIPHQYVVLGETLSFYASATDFDQPPQSLSYSLGSGAPPGASISASTGQFLWTPDSGPATNQFNVLVTDNGIPPLSALQPVTVTVALPPPLGGITASAGQFSFSWPTLPGQKYQLEYSNTVPSATWFPLGVPVTGTGNPITEVINLNSPSQRFYRVSIVP